jgi:O-acetyl-ADP-ribose deacetylase (regulator of RNase III)/uncharacterized protein YwgA
MVEVVLGNLFESSAQTLVNTVNCVGVMGKGVALEFKNRFPEMYEDYVARCRRGAVKLGKPYLYRRPVLPWIVNFPTKDHWRSVSRLDDILAGLTYLEQNYRDWGITSLAVPPLGCGQGQLEWRVVGPTLYRYFRRFQIPVEIYAPFGTPAEELQRSFLSPDAERDAKESQSNQANRIDSSWVALLEILDRIEKQPYHRPIGRTTFQKIAYFATQARIPTHLEYQRGSYGPYAPGMKAVLTRLTNNSLIREERLGQMLRVTTGPTFRDAKRAYRQDIDQWDEQIERIADLFMRMDTRQAEITATAHFAAQELQNGGAARPTEMEVLSRALDWKQKRRPPLDTQELALAVRELATLGWLNVAASPDLPLDEASIVEG